jgi:hypothetical protein
MQKGSEIAHILGTARAADGRGRWEWQVESWAIEEEAT